MKTFTWYVDDMNPYQTVVQWPKKTKDKCFDLYLQGYSAPQIESITKVPANTIYMWSHTNPDGPTWSKIRNKVATDYEARAKATVETALTGLDIAVKTASKLLAHTEAYLDNPDSHSASQGASSATSQKATVETLETLANVLEKTSDVLLRIFSK